MFSSFYAWKWSEIKESCIYLFFLTVSSSVPKPRKKPYFWTFFFHSPFFRLFSLMSCLIPGWNVPTLAWYKIRECTGLSQNHVCNRGSCALRRVWKGHRKLCCQAEFLLLPAGPVKSPYLHTKGAFKTPTNSVTGSGRLSLENSPAPGTLKNLNPNWLLCSLYKRSSWVTASRTKKTVNTMLPQAQILKLLIIFRFWMVYPCI